MGATLRGGAMGRTGSRRHRIWTLALLLAVGALAQACSDNKGSSEFPATVTGTTQGGLFLVQVVANPPAIELGRQTTITVFVLSLNGVPVPGRQVDVSSTGGVLNPTSGVTDANGRFNTVLSLPCQGGIPVGATAVTVTALVEGIIAAGTVNIAAPTANTPCD